MKSRKPVYVVWIDAVSSDAWEDREEAEKLKLAEIHTLGFLIKETEDTLLVAQNLDTQNDKVSQTILIPKVWVVLRKNLDRKQLKAKNAKASNG